MDLVIIYDKNIIINSDLSDRVIKMPYYYKIPLLVWLTLQRDIIQFIEVNDYEKDFHNYISMATLYDIRSSGIVYAFICQK